MKARVLVAIVAIPILALIIFLAPAWLLGLTVGIISALSTWEFLRCAEEGVPMRIHAVSAVCAFFTPFCAVFYPSGRVYEIVLLFLAIYLFCELMYSLHKDAPLSLAAVTNGLLAGGILPVFLSAIVRLGLRDNGSVYAALPLVVAFSCDSGAYFIGIALGKRKLAPKVSPHKTIEGSIGGFLCAIVLTVVYGCILRALGYAVDLAVLAVYGFLGALACQVGDLSFSVVKRLTGVKDYGNLIPGHGGVLDRFDSMYWTAALIELLVAWVPAITR